MKHGDEMTEKQFETKVKAYLTKQNCWFLKTWSNGVQRVGVPDLLVCCNGHFLGIELKASNGKPSKLQLYNIEQIRKAGGMAFLLYPDKFYLLQDLITDLKIGFKIDWWKKHLWIFDKERGCET